MYSKEENKNILFSITPKELQIKLVAQIKEQIHTPLICCHSTEKKDDKMPQYSRTINGGGRIANARFVWRPLLPVNLNTALATEPREVRNAGNSGTQTTPPHSTGRRFLACVLFVYMSDEVFRKLVVFYVFVNTFRRLFYVIEH